MAFVGRNKINIVIEKINNNFIQKQSITIKSMTFYLQS